ncbi:MAG: 30S ribosomal protein S20 [Fimbriimonadaceae bacterium]
MANLKSSKKDIKRTEKRRVKNQAAKSAIKTYIKKVRIAATPEDAQKALVVAQGALDKAVQHGVLHKNQAARRMSRAAKAAAKTQ